MIHEFTCTVCHAQKRHEDDLTTGYGVIEGRKVCFECCGDQDRASMRQTGRAVLYLSKIGADWFVSNWPGTLRICTNFPGVCVGRHNIAGRRYDVWFNFEGCLWHGVTYGDNTQLCHVKRTKQRSMKGGN